MNDNIQRTHLLLLRRARAWSETMRYHRAQDALLVSIPYVAWRGPYVPVARALPTSLERTAK